MLSVLPAGDVPHTYGIDAALVQHNCCPQHFRLQNSILDVLSVYSIHLSELVDVTAPQPGSSVASDHEALSTPRPLFKRPALLYSRRPLYTHLAPSVHTLLYMRPSHE